MVLRPTRTGLALTLAMVIVGSGSSIAMADKAPPALPTQGQLDAASAAVSDKRAGLEQIESDLVSANARVLGAAHDAEIAAEAYNGARWRLEQARAEHEAASAGLAQARRAVTEQRDQIAVLVADSYQRGSGLNAATVLLSNEGPEGVMNRLGVARAAGDSMQAKFLVFKQAKAEADEAERRAKRAETAQQVLVAEARTAQSVAQHAASQAQDSAEALKLQEAGLAEELTRAENISADLARQRQVGLARQAAQRAAGIEKARQSDERLSAPAESGPDSNRPESNQADSDKAAADDAPPVVADPPPAGSGVSAALNYARSKLGLPYRWGASGPSSFDCSGLTMMAWRAGGKSLPHYSAAQYSASTPISRAALRPGDLVFWGSSPRSIHHVALYIGNGQILHAPRTGQPVRVDSIDYWIAPRYFGRP